jgi:hypothetical protein
MVLLIIVLDILVDTMKAVDMKDLTQFMEEPLIIILTTNAAEQLRLQRIQCIMLELTKNTKHVLVDIPMTITIWNQLV